MPVTDPLHATFVVAYVLGVTPGKWAGIWNERMPRHPLELRPVSPADAVAALVSGEAHVALLRLPLAAQLSEQRDLSTIPLYVEKPVVVAPKDHAIEAVDSVTLGELDDVIEGDWAAAVELVAANAGVAVMPQSVARALSRRDVVARPVSDGVETRIALVWPTDLTSPEIEEFIGIVRGRTANSSRGEPTPKTPKPVRPPRPPRPKSTRPRRR
jgi:DNA-binding transcriptional LysR family regulator